MGILFNMGKIIRECFGVLRKTKGIVLSFVSLLATLFIILFFQLRAVYYTLLLTPGTFLIAAIWIFREKRTNDEDGETEEEDIEKLHVEGMPVRYNRAQLIVATRKFREKIGSGGFGSVFRGTLENGQEIAVKRLGGSGGQGSKEFVAEVRTIGSIHHINLVKLIGYCAEKNHRALVYPFMCNGSLDKWIFGGDLEWIPLDWLVRKKIILGIAKGMAYLHEECTQKIAHLDIKPQNILLGPNFDVKISDFGLSRLIDRDQSQVATRARGTFGYMAPEVCHRAAISVKADVYSFGVVVIEIVCGRKNLDGPENEDLVSLLMEKTSEEELINLVDQSTKDMQLYEAEAVEMLRLAIWCLQRDPDRRPRMSTVVNVLEGTRDIEAILDYENDNPEEMQSMSVEASVLSGPR